VTGEVALIAGLIVAIALTLWLKARQTIRREAGRPRGIAPGEGDHIIDVEYSSGLGGGHATQIRVPRDPQAYARRFVPRSAQGADEGAKRHGAVPREQEKDER
jgi:hypothetical protein